MAGNKAYYNSFLLTISPLNLPEPAFLSNRASTALLGLTRSTLLGRRGNARLPALTNTKRNGVVPTASYSD